MTDLDKNNNSYQPGLSIDCVILGFHEGKLKMLLKKYKAADRWMLPGGFIRKDESVEDAAKRIMFLRTGLHDVYLTQFHTFGDPNRIDLAENKKMLTFLNLYDDSHWLMNRFVSIGYYAFVDYAKTKIMVAEEEEIDWVEAEDDRMLYADHGLIIDYAISAIRAKLGYVPIGTELLPEKFTMSELRTIYETVIGKKLDRRNFQRKMLMANIVLPLGEMSKKKGVKSAALFTVNREKLIDCLNGELPFF